MQTVKISQLNHLSYKQFQRCKAAQMEAAKVWNVCMQTHKAALLAGRIRRGQDETSRSKPPKEGNLNCTANRSRWSATPLNWLRNPSPKKGCGVSR